jgi:hypothetical protein
VVVDLVYMLSRYLTKDSIQNTGDDECRIETAHSRVVIT